MIGRAKFHALNVVIFFCGLVLGTLSIWMCNFIVETKVAELSPTEHAENIVEVKDFCINNNIDFEYVAKCTIAEAGTEADLCKRLVADCIFNQAELFSLSTTEVINKPHNFEVVSKKIINRVTVTEGDIELVKEEYEKRTSDKVLFFRTDYYHDFGKPYKQLKNMYFSTN